MYIQIAFRVPTENTKKISWIVPPQQEEVYSLVILFQVLNFTYCVDL